MFRTRFSLFDGLLIASILTLAIFAALLPLLWQESGSLLQISTPDESLSYNLSLDQTVTVTSGEHTLTVEISDGRARVLDSDCPDALCVAAGWIEKSGDSIVCAPLGVRLSVLGSKGGSHVDFVAG